MLARGNHTPLRSRSEGVWEGYARTAQIERARPMSIAQPGGIAPSRHAVAQFATGGSLLIAGALFAAPFLLNGRALENDVFLSNLFLAPLISLLGSLLYLLA